MLFAKDATYDEEWYHRDEGVSEKHEDIYVSHDENIGK